MPNSNRRAVLKGIGAATAGVSFGVGSASASAADERFLINLREVSRGEIPDDVEIVHDLSQADVLVARGDSSTVGGAMATAPDVALDLSDDTTGAVVEADGPVASGSSASHNHDGPASNSEYQWDKRDQNLSNELTDNPGNGRSVHDVSTGEGTRIAVVDSGVYDGHPDLADVVNGELSENLTEDGFDWRPNGAGSHGTHVAGTIAATNSVDDGVLGTAPDTEIVSYRMFSGKEGFQGDGYAGWVKAAEAGCDAINYSVGFPFPYVFPEELPLLRAEKQIAEQVAEYVRSQGTVVVNSAGNDGLDMSASDPERGEILSVPTEAEGVFGVAATGPIGFSWGSKQDDNEEKWLKRNALDQPTTEPAFYTNYGGAVDVSAAGGNADLEAIRSNPKAYNDLVYSTINKTDENGDVVSGYGWKAGTSMAAPQVTGAVALVKSLRPNATPDEVEGLIRETASMPEEGERYHGSGHLDLEALVRAAAGEGTGKGN